MPNENKIRKFKISKKALLFFLTALTAATAFIMSSCERTVQNIPTETELEGGGTGILADNNAVEFYFYYPENCALDKNSAMITVYIPDAEIAQSNIQDLESSETLSVFTKPNVSVTKFGLPDGKYETADDYWNNSVFPAMSAIYQNVEAESAEDITIDGISAKKYTYTAEVAGMTFKYCQIILFRNRQVYDILYTSLPGKFDAYANVLDTVAETFKFK